MKQQKLECQLQKWGLNHQERSRRGQKAVTWVFKLEKKTYIRMEGLTTIVAAYHEGCAKEL